MRKPIVYQIGRYIRCDYVDLLNGPSAALVIRQTETWSSEAVSLLCFFFSSSRTSALISSSWWCFAEVAVWHRLVLRQQQLTTIDCSPNGDAERLRRDGACHIVWWHAASVRVCGWDILLITLVRCFRCMRISAHSGPQTTVIYHYRERASLLVYIARHKRNGS